jgi:hypothetical protein
VLAEEDEVEAEVPGEAHLLDRLGEALTGRLRRKVLVRDQEPEAH